MTLVGYCLCILLFTFSCGRAFKIYFEQEDLYEDDENTITNDNRSFQLIFPGTYWCGTGNISSNNYDLGKYPETDICCREHDFCDDTIDAGQSKYNLTNNSFYTKLSCECDEKFYDCLKSGGGRPSKAVGTVYFSVLGTQCYREDYPILRCLKYHKVVKTRCLEYELNHSAPKVWQWFDVPPY